jgi:hypothetical protein
MLLECKTLELLYSLKYPMVCLHRRLVLQSLLSGYQDQKQCSNFVKSCLLRSKDLALVRIPCSLSRRSTFDHPKIQFINLEHYLLNVRFSRYFINIILDLNLEAWEAHKLYFITQACIESIIFIHRANVILGDVCCELVELI